MLLFSDLYKIADSESATVVSVKALASQIVARHSDIGEVNFWAVDLDPTISFGHIRFDKDRSSPYGETYRVANIRYHRPMNRCWRRFVCCKELMHVFDSPEERVDGREKFLTLMEELESTPLSSDASPMYQSEIRAQWMALLCLAPKRLRDPFVEMLRQGAMSPYDVAVRLKIPEAYISAISTDYYNKVLDHLVE